MNYLLGILQIYMFTLNSSPGVSVTENHIICVPANRGNNFRNLWSRVS